jgi:hypothetical protein
MTPTKTDLRLNLEVCIIEKNVSFACNEMSLNLIISNLFSYCKIIALSRMALLNKAFILANEFLELPCVRIHNLTGKFFPFTVY